MEYRASVEPPRAVSSEREAHPRRGARADGEEATRRDTRERSVAGEEGPISANGRTTAWSPESRTTGQSMQAFHDASQLLTEEVTQTTLQQPEPRPPKRPYASFLKDFVDPIHPHPRPESLHALVSEWLESVGSDREKRCRSDSHLHHLDHDPVSRQLTRSAPEVGYTRDADGFAVPPTPASTRSRTSRVDSEDDSNRSSAFSTANTRNPWYRQTNLRFNHIYVRHPASPLPDLAAGHIDSIRAQRDSPELSSDELNQAIYRVDALAEGCNEDQVADFLNDTIFPNPEADTTYGTGTGLTSNSNTLMAQHLVPIAPASPYRVTQPKTGRLYGYSERTMGAFTEPQLLAQTMLHPRNPDYPTATS